MSQKSQKTLEQIVPFLVLGVAIAVLFSLFIMLSYVLIWGFIIGTILWLIVWVKNYFFPKTKVKKSSGRIIEHDDKR